VPGNLVEVEITSVVDFGAFGKLPEGVQGLIHQSELGYSAPGYEESLIESGTKVLVKILNINAERERIALSMQKVPLEKQIDWMVEASEQDKENGEADQSVPEDED
jgi:ribosomal protein S1